MNKKEQALEIIKRLKNEYPDADCTLDYDDAWKLLVSVRLAAQCTDARVNMVTPALFEKYRTVEDFANAEISDVENLIHSCGFFRAKAKDIVEMCKKMIAEYEAEDHDELLGAPRQYGLTQNHKHLPEMQQIVDKIYNEYK